MALCHISCKPQQRQPNDKQIVDKPKEEETCEISSKPKLFLDFWGQMNENDFNCIEQALVKSHKLSYQSGKNTTYYVINNDSLEIGNEYENDKLLKVTLNYHSNPFDDNKKIKIGGVTHPESIVDSSFFIEIKTSLYAKYGPPTKDLKISIPKDFSNQEDDPFIFKLQPQYSSTEWIKFDKIIVFTKILSPVYIEYSEDNNYGSSIERFHINKYEITGVIIEYIDKDLNDLISKKNNEAKREDDDKTNKKLEKL